MSEALAARTGHAEWSPPSEFDGYRLIRLIGRGEMGRIYLAEDTLLDRPVAVKFIASVRPDELSRQRFLVEARALARLSHPGVVAVHRVGDIDGRPYLVAEFIRGKSLADLDRPMPWERALRLGLGLARGLGAAHRHGVLHRDLKPENAMLTEGGEVKLIDFGLAKLMAERAAPASPPLPLQAPPASRRAATLAAEGNARASGPLTRADALVGTPLYMAPEALRGDPATRQSDVYALGAVLYELCAGAAHREAVPPDAPLDAWIDAAPASLAKIVKGIDPGLAAAIARCLDPDPARRFPSGEALADALEQVDVEEASAPVPEGNPYRGLQAFEAEHRALFYGRDADIRAAIDRLRAEPLVVVAGDSGVGKSSLCRAGVIPRVAEGALGEGRAFQVVTLVPGARPLEALAAAVQPLLTGPGDDAAPPSSRLLPAEDPEPLVRDLQRRMGRVQGALVFVDQLEELFTLAEPAEAARFAEILARLGSLAAGVRVLATVRGDFFTRLASLPALGGELSRALYVLRPLGPEAIRTAILAPARRTGVTFESEALVDALVEAGAEAAGGLPLLQFAMAELWDARDPVAQRIPASALDAIGGVVGALARHADAVVASLAPAEQSAARRVLCRLVTAEGTRARRTEAELGLDDEAARVALEALICGRLVVARETGGVTAYEVAHEALVRGWSALGAWLDRDREERRARERVEAAAAEWRRLDGAPEALWSERQLAGAERTARLGEGALGPLGPDERAFLAASRRRIRRARLVRAASIAAAPLLVGLGLGGLRLKAQLDLDRVIAGHQESARASAEEGQRLKAEADALRRRAFAGFDAASGRDAAEARETADAAERIWTEGLEAAGVAEAALVRAGQALEAGLSLDPGRASLRAALADTLVQRIELAEWFHHEERREDLARRLGLYDEGDARRRWLEAPPRIALETTPPGAEVTIGRYEDEGGRRVLRHIRPLGRTPLEEIAIEAGPGSYLLTVTSEGRAEVRLPMLLGRGEHARAALDLPPAGAVPEGYLYIPPGRFLFGSADVEGLRRGMLRAQPQREITTAGYLIGRTEVTYGDWMPFLRDLPAEERAKRTPSTRNRQFGVRLEELPGGTFQLTLVVNDVPLTAREGELFRIAGRARRAEQDWRRFPVTAIALDDALAYAAWLRATGRLPGARLCDEREWERAARGADDRLYPHGDRLDPDDANIDETYGRVSHAFGPDEVGAHPASASLFGALDMAGNALEMARSAGAREELLVRGGAWYYDPLTARATNRSIIEPQTRDTTVGLRVCADLPPR